MIRSIRLATAAAALALVAGAAPSSLQAQATTMEVVCAEGVGCSQLRFNLTSSADIFLNTLTLELTGGTWRFAEPTAPGVGTYIAVDTYGEAGAFGGFSTISNGGSTLFIDFLGPDSPGWPFELLAGETGYLQVEGINDTPADLVVSYSGTIDGGTIAGRAAFGVAGPPPSVVPEPATVVLLGSGLAGLGLFGHRRRQQRSV